MRERLGAAVREAGALALQTFRGPLKSWIKGELLAGQRGRSCGRRAAARTPAGAFRAVGWLSEETEDDPARLDESDVWIVDPIDGTRAYLAGLPDWVVSVALVSAGRPVVAALFAPVTDELFLSVLARGATLNGASIAASAGERLAGAKFSGPKRRLDSLAAVEPLIEAAPRVPSLALRLARVATGALDGHLRGPEQPRLGPCGGRSFGARSRRRRYDFDGAIADLQSARSGAWGC